MKKNTPASSLKIGLWLIGVKGGISMGVIWGALALRKRLITTVGLVTESEFFNKAALCSLDNIQLGGCDIHHQTLLERAVDFAKESGCNCPELLADISEEIQQLEEDVVLGTATNCGGEISQFADPGLMRQHCTLRQEIGSLQKHLSGFKNKYALDEVVVINLASTEPPLVFADDHLQIEAFERLLDNNRREAVRASTLYAYAAIQEQCPYINFTPSNAALPPALILMAEHNHVPVMGNDGKTGETLVKSALAPMFASRNLEILSWEGFNILGNQDGRVLNNPLNRESKLKTKDAVLHKILGYEPHSRVHINYVPSMGDQKTAWDFIHFQGFLGARMSLQFTWQGYDSLLAAPLILDLARLAVLARKRGESGLMPQLASFFKAPLGVMEYRHAAQFELLRNYLNKI